ARTQELRAAALGFDLADAERREIGARSRAGANDAPDRYREAMATVLGEARRVLRPRGACVVVIGDSIAGDRTRNTTVAGDRTLEDAARAAGLEWVATASQDRPALPPAPAVPRREHVLVF